MAYKLLDSKVKCLIVGIFSGILIATFVPDLLLKNKFKSKSFDDILDGKNVYEFAEYSQWPPFLTDSTFDLVKPSTVFI